MGKRRKDERPADAPAPAFHTPFSGLGDLARGLPPGPGGAAADATSAGVADARKSDPGTSSVPTADPRANAEGAGGRAAGDWPDTVVLRHERKGRGGKTVTRIAGVPATRLDATARALRRALGCGATVEGEDVVLLGSVADRAAAWLRAEGARRVVVGN